MGKQVKNILNFVAWVTGVIVSLAVGFAMIGGSLTIPWLDAVGAGIVTIVTGWVVVITTIVSAAMAILKQ
jgi:hypothetical protein